MWDIEMRFQILTGYPVRYQDPDRTSCEISRWDIISYVATGYLVSISRCDSISYVETRYLVSIPVFQSEYQEIFLVSSIDMGRDVNAFYFMKTLEQFCPIKLKILLDTALHARTASTDFSIAWPMNKTCIQSEKYIQIMQEMEKLFSTHHCRPIIHRNRCSINKILKN